MKQRQAGAAVCLCFADFGSNMNGAMRNRSGPTYAAQIVITPRSRFAFDHGSKIGNILDDGQFIVESGRLAECFDYPSLPPVPREVEILHSNVWNGLEKYRLFIRHQGPQTQLIRGGR